MAKSVILNCNSVIMNVNRLILGDNLEIMKTMDSETIDLIYLDPPFFSNRNYEIIWGDDGEVRSFKDRWSGGMDHYIAWLKERVEQMHRLLKPTGSIFLHCDWHANAYIRVDILDKIFGYGNFRGEIIWQRATAHSDAKKKLAVLSDSIFWFSKSAKFYYSPSYVKHNENYVRDFYRNDDNNGRGIYRLDNMAAPAGGGMSAINPNTGKPNGWYIYKGFYPPEKGWRYSIDTMEKLDSEGRIYFPKMKNGDFDYSKRLCLKRYLNELQGQIVGNIWTDISMIQSQSKELIGYPTQKPESLLERILAMSSKEYDYVMDPFIGGGTLAVVASKMKRKWIGIDQSVQAIKVSEYRLNAELDLFSDPFIVQLHKYDYDTLRFKDAFQFENWIVTQFGGQPNVKQRGDLGMDGKAQDGAPIQVKRSDAIGRNVIDNFHSALQRYDKKLYDKNRTEGKPAGYIIAFSFGRGAIEEVARLKNKENVIISLVEVGSIVPISKKPDLKVEIIELDRDNKGIRDLEFRASAASEADIEFFSWDWDYNDQTGFKPEVIIEKQGIQRQKFKPGIHQIAVKVVDNDGLENIEIIKLKVNGSIEKI
jgi:DNA modification methylase